MNYLFSSTTWAENLVYHLSPLWEVWSQQRQDFIEPLFFLIQEKSQEIKEEDDPDRGRFLWNAEWLLDQLAPLAYKDQFWSLIEMARSKNQWAGHLFYAWGRRLQREERKQLFDPNLVELSGYIFGSLGSQSLWTATFCSAYTNDDPIDPILPFQVLLEIWGVQTECIRAEPSSNSILQALQRKLPIDTEEAFILLIRDLNKKIALASEARNQFQQELLKFIEFVNQQEQVFEFQGLALARNEAFCVLANDFALKFPPPPDPLPESSDLKVVWFAKELYQAGYIKFAKLVEQTYQIGSSHTQWMPSYAFEFWLRRHTKETWPKLKELLKDKQDGYRCLHHLSRFIPQDRLEDWEPVLSLEKISLFAFVEFCRWIKSEYRDLLIPYFSHSNSDLASCAVRAYLHKTPRFVLQSLWQKGFANLFPTWQQFLWDRYLFAPDVLKPLDRSYDIQEKEADYRLTSPFI